VFRFLFATGNNTVVTPVLVPISCCVIDVFTAFAFSNPSDMNKKLTKDQRVFLLQTWWMKDNCSIY
jgi:hypothetical protein